MARLGSTPCFSLYILAAVLQFSMVCAWYSCDLKSNSVKDYIEKKGCPSRQIPFPRPNVAIIWGQLNQIDQTYPWEKFILATFIPFSMSSRRVAGSLETGPMVQTIPESLILFAVLYMFRFETNSTFKLQTLIASWEKGYLHG